MKTILYSTLSLILAATTFAEPTVLSDQDLLHLDRLRDQSPICIVRRALEQEHAFREATKNEILWMSQSVSTQLARTARSFSDVRAAVLKRMQDDLSYVKSLNAQLASLDPGKNEVTWSCKTNKLVEILTEAIPFFETHANQILKGVLPTEFEGYWASIRCLGPCENRAPGHNSRELALKTSLLLSLAELKGSSHMSDDFIYPLVDSAVVHTTQLPKDKVYADIQKLSFFYNGTQSPVEGELLFVHGGYAFGGQVSDYHFREMGPYGKRFGPQDCSSWASKVIGRVNAMSTAHFVDYARAFEMVEAILTQHADSKPQLVPVKVSSIHDVQPGMVRIARRFDTSIDPGMNTTLGTSGHAQLVVEVEPETNTIITVEYSRNLPVLEGFGAKRDTYEVPAHTKQFYFHVNEASNVCH